MLVMCLYAFEQRMIGLLMCFSKFVDLNVRLRGLDLFQKWLSEIQKNRA